MLIRDHRFLDRVMLATSLCLLCASWVRCDSETELAATPAPVFEKDVLPIFKTKCLSCHSDKTQKGALNLSSRAGLEKGSESGPVLVPGKPDESTLFDMIHEQAMPPEDEGEPLTEAELARIESWIETGAVFAAQKEPASTAEVSQHDVIPILLRRCTMCHGSVHTDGDLDLRTAAAMLKGGKSGPALIKGKPLDSPMIARIESKQCPPAKSLSRASIEPMTTEEQAVLKRWIALGAPEVGFEPDVANSALVSSEDREFWSFQPPIKSAPPAVRSGNRVRNPIDAFLLAKLEAADLGYSPETDKRTLLRRASFALTGLPPTREEARLFLEDDRPLAYERLIDRLLASPRYGEKWGRFWLDLAGYADSEGKRNADTVRPWAWRYRDYVIRSFNADKPYDQFLAEQIAGDEMVDSAARPVTQDVIEKLEATGFLRMAPDGTAANPVNRFTDRLEVITDEIDVLCRGVLGLTMKCARCHTHKYDPIPQRDYYRFMAIFKGAYDEYEWMVPQKFGNQWDKATVRLLPVATAEQQRQVEEHNAPIQAKIDALTAERKGKETDNKRKKAIDAQIKSLKSKLKPPVAIRALWDRGQPSPTYLYRRGDEFLPSDPVEPGVPTVLGSKGFDVQPPEHSTPKTGRRLALARWLTRPDHPLTARVFVNRVWRQHFGVGIVKSLDNFGSLGTPPTHPELLDWLAVDFVEHSWSPKRLHRLIMTAGVYRQQSAVTERLARRDPENRLLSRMPMRRMSAGEVRDALLMTAGVLNTRAFGTPDQVAVRKDGLVTSKPEQDGSRRRSIYVRQRRKEMPSILETFDLPQMNPNCSERVASTVVSQPLHLLNNQMVHELAGAFGRRVAAEAGSDRYEQVALAWRLALNRPPDRRELQLGTDALDELTQHWQAELKANKESDQSPQQKALAEFCHALLNSAAFLYID